MSKYLKRKQYAKLVSLISKVSRVGEEEMLKIMSKKVKKELNTYTKKEDTILRKFTPLTVENLDQFSLARTVLEFSEICPTATAFLRASLNLRADRSVNIIPIMGVLICHIAYAHKPNKMGVFQQMNAMQMWLAGCKREVSILIRPKLN